jgi:hypothetical protein
VDTHLPLGQPHVVAITGHPRVPTTRGHFILTFDVPGSSTSPADLVPPGGISLASGQTSFFALEGPRRIRHRSCRGEVVVILGVSRLGRSMSRYSVETCQASLRSHTQPARIGSYD